MSRFFFGFDNSLSVNKKNFNDIMLLNGWGCTSGNTILAHALLHSINSCKHYVSVRTTYYLLQPTYSNSLVICMYQTKIEVKVGVLAIIY